MLPPAAAVPLWQPAHVSRLGVFTSLDVYDGRVNAVPKSTRMMRTALQRTSIEMRIGFTVVSPDAKVNLVVLVVQ